MTAITDRERLTGLATSNGWKLLPGIFADTETWERGAVQVYCEYDVHNALHLAELWDADGMADDVSPRDGEDVATVDAWLTACAQLWHTVGHTP